MGDAGVRGVGDNWCTHRDMDSVQESSRCKQTKPSLWPTRPAGRIRDHSGPLARARGAQPGARMVCPTCYRDSLPGRESNSDGLGTVEREIARKGSPRPAAVPRTRHTPNRQHTQEGHTGNAHWPQSTARNRQLANGSTQHAARSTQHRKEVTPHMHTPATTHPQDRHTQRTAATTLTLGEPTPPAHPAPASAAEPAPAPAPARLRLRLDPGRRTVRPAAPTAPQPPPLPLPIPPPLPLPLPLSLRPHRHTRPASPGPRKHTPTPATPASVAASPNPDRHGARPGNTTAKARHRTVAAVCSPAEDQPGPSQTPAGSPHLFIADRLNPNRNGVSARRTHPNLRRARSVAAGLKPNRRPARPRQYTAGQAPTAPSLIG